MDSQKQFFEQAYKTGSDLWTSVNKTIEMKNFLSLLPKEGMILDIGCGRGRIDFALVDLGHKVIGLDYVKDIVESNNDEAKTRNVLDKVRFVEGSAFDIPFADASFDGALDIGVAHHFTKDELVLYRDEISRVLKKGGLLFLVVLAHETPKYLTFLPAQSEVAEFDFHGVHYHFFAKEELDSTFGSTFDLLEHETMELKDKENALYHVRVLKRK